MRYTSIACCMQAFIFIIKVSLLKLVLYYYCIEVSLRSLATICRQLKSLDTRSVISKAFQTRMKAANFRASSTFNVSWGF